MSPLNCQPTIIKIALTFSWKISSCSEQSILVNIASKEYFRSNDKANDKSYWDNIGKQNKMTKSKTKNFLHDKYFLKYMYIYHLCQDKRKLKLFTKATPSVSRGGYFWEFLVGVCHPVLQILTLFQTKNCHFHTCFQTRPLKSIPVFRPGL